MPAPTLVHQLAELAARQPDAPALHGKVDGEWVARTWGEFWQETRAVAKGLAELGHRPGDCVAIVGDNRPEWVLLELGIMAAGGVPAPIYGTNTVEQTAFIVDNARARIAICDSRAQYEKYRRGQDAGLFTIDWIVTMDDLGEQAEDVVTYAELVSRGRERDDRDLDARIAALSPDETGLLIYTSGTTGTPKGVMLDHGAMVEVAAAVLKRLPAFASGEVPYRIVSYLPLCHGAEQLVTTMGLLATGGSVYFCPDIKQIRDYLLDVRPTFFLGVPRVWEKFEGALSARLAEATGVKRALLGWARSVELAAVRRQSETGQRHDSLARRLANRLVLAKIRAAVGFDQVHFAATGSAPISVGTLEFFASLGVVVNEAYGMSETTGVCTIGEPTRPRLGKVGTPLDGVSIRIADDGEVQLRGRLMTRGYLHMPEQTAELYTADGWLCTGDIGTLDEDGFLAITGRKKELLITAGGKNVAPLEMEAYMQQIHGVAQAVVVGDRQPFLSALVTIDVEALPELAKRFSVPATVESLAASDAFGAYVRDRVEAQCNSRVARYQTIKKLRILPVEFSVDGGELTPTMKLRRNVIATKYAAEIAAFYSDVDA